LPGRGAPNAPPRRSTRSPSTPNGPGAAPAAIRDALLPEERATFDAAYQRALTRAREDLELTELFQTLEHWRRLALRQRDPDRSPRSHAEPRNA
jgi:Family of unknown function (DUF6247)